MNKRPIPVTAVAWLYILVGVASLIFHVKEFTALRNSTPRDFALICLIRLLAVVAGAFLLLAKDWARWLALAWMAFHVVVSAFNSVDMLAMHGALFLLIAYILLGREARAYFRPGPPAPAA
jgi:hypothetical protein